MVMKTYKDTMKGVTLKTDKAKEIKSETEKEILKFLTLNPESNLVDIEKHISSWLISIVETRWDKGGLARTALNQLAKRGTVLATPCKKAVIKVVPQLVRAGHTRQMMVDKEVTVNVWFTYSVTGAKRNSLIGEHIYGI
jgi:hypothetical protein